MLIALRLRNMKETAVIIKTKGIVLSRRSLTAGDKSLTVLTSDMGVIPVYAKHTGNKKSRLAPCCEALSYSEFCLLERGGRYTVDSAELLQNFFALREDLNNLSLASYFLELTRYVMPDAESSQPVLRLLLNTLYLLEKRKRSPLLLKAIYEFRLLSELGFTPDISICRGCGREDLAGTWFLPLEGQILCEDCCSKNLYDKYKIYLPPAVRKAIWFILFSEDKKLFSFQLDEEGIKILSKTAESFVLCHTGGKFASLDFYKSL